MKTTFIIFAFFVSVSFRAQMFLEHTYDSAATTNFCGSGGGASQLMVIKFENSGEHYVRINRCGKSVSVYNLGHSLVKQINMAGLPMSYGSLGTILYFSEKLFNPDNLMEFMYVYDFTANNGNGLTVTNIYNENLNLLFTDTSVAWIIPNIHLQQYPIYNTSAGTKMILSCQNGSNAKGKARVFSLPGTLTTAIQKNTEDLVEEAYSRVSPNPVQREATFFYELPEGNSRGELVIIDLLGKEIRTYPVDSSQRQLKVSTNDFAAGTYIYQLKVNGQRIGKEKMVIVK